MEERKKRKWKISIRLLIIGAVVIYAIIVLINQQITLSEQAAQKEELQAQATELANEQESLERKLEYVDTDEYIEQTARERLGWIKEGEIIFRRTKDGQVVTATVEEMQELLGQEDQTAGSGQDNSAASQDPQTSPSPSASQSAQTSPSPSDSQGASAQPSQSVYPASSGTSDGPAVSSVSMQQS